MFYSQHYTMGRPKRFRQRRHISVVFESTEHDNLRIVAAAQQLSVSEYIRDLVLHVLWGKSEEEAPPDNQASDEPE
jgi:hypothetical protein